MTRFYRRYRIASFPIASATNHARHQIYRARFILLDNGARFYRETRRGERGNPGLFHARRVL